MLTPLSVANLAVAQSLELTRARHVKSSDERLSLILHNRHRITPASNLTRINVIAIAGGARLLSRSSSCSCPSPYAAIELVTP